jgi:galactokinase
MQHASMSLSRCRVVAHLFCCLSCVCSDSNVKHGLGDGQYELRVKQCAAAVKTLQIKWPNIQKLRDASLQQLMAMESAMDEEAFYRARHVITENDRTQQSDTHRV